jgi:hypothetical protein
MDLFRITIDLPLPDETFPRAKALVGIEIAMDNAGPTFNGLDATIRHEIVPAQPGEPVRTRKPRAQRAVEAPPAAQTAQADGTDTPPVTLGLDGTTVAPDGTIRRGRKHPPE